MLTNGLIRAVAQVDSAGKIILPKNILRAMDLKEKDVLELKVVRSSKVSRIIMSKPRK